MAGELTDFRIRASARSSAALTPRTTPCRIARPPLATSGHSARCACSLSCSVGSWLAASKSGLAVCGPSLEDPSRRHAERCALMLCHRSSTSRPRMCWFSECDVLPLAGIFRELSCPLHWVSLKSLNSSGGKECSVSDCLGSSAVSRGQPEATRRMSGICLLWRRASRDADSRLMLLCMSKESFTTPASKMNTSGSVRAISVRAIPASGLQ